MLLSYSFRKYSIPFDMEFLGERSILEIKSGETSYKVLTDPQKNIKKGDSLKIYYKKENVMIFHPETEDLI